MKGKDKTTVEKQNVILHFLGYIRRGRQAQRLIYGNVLIQQFQPEKLKSSAQVLSNELSLLFGIKVYLSVGLGQSSHKVRIGCRYKSESKVKAQN